MKVLVTCPPMLGMLEEFMQPAADRGLELVAADTVQIMTEAELMALLPDFDGWIIGDDPATRAVFEAGANGKLKAAVKWGIGIDNVDFRACEDLGIPITNTPNMFGREVADVAIAYILGLARQTCLIDREIRASFAWPKPVGMSMEGKVIGIVGFGDIGYHTARKLAAFDVALKVYDPGVDGDKGLAGVERNAWPDGLQDLDFLVFTCSLNDSNQHMLNAKTLKLLKTGAAVVNVARGPLIDEPALVAALKSGQVSAAALDVFEQEPLPSDSPLREMRHCIFGSHNGSNTAEGVRRASFAAIDKLAGFLHDV